VNCGGVELLIAKPPEEREREREREREKVALADDSNFDRM
jgi:hypothetical protein